MRLQMEVYAHHFAKFSKRQRKNTYLSLTEIQKLRWDAFMGASLNEKVLKDLIYEIIGSKPND